MLPRPAHTSTVTELLARFPVVGLIGPRQVGKTTLARAVAARGSASAAFFDLESTRDLSRLNEPLLALERLNGLVVLDEIHNRPDLFPVLRVLADRPNNPARFLVLGSATPSLLRQGSESLAGRIAYHELSGFDLSEVGVEQRDPLWLRGGFPLAFLADLDSASTRWRREFIRTFLERDLGSFGIGLRAPAMRRFWTMLAHNHAQVLNLAELGRAFGVAEKTVRSYLDVLVATFMAVRLLPWHENISKRQVKAPKVYVADSGLLHTLLGIETFDELLGNPKVGASWEGFALAEVVRRLRAEPEECFFWALHSGAELDLLVVRGTRRLGFEFKLSDAPRTTASMHSAIQNLHLERLDVVHAGKQSYELASNIRALSLSRLGEESRTGPRSVVIGSRNRNSRTRVGRLRRELLAQPRVDGEREPLDSRACRARGSARALRCGIRGEQCGRRSSRGAPDLGEVQPGSRQ